MRLQRCGETWSTQDQGKKGGGGKEVIQGAVDVASSNRHRRNVELIFVKLSHVQHQLHGQRVQDAQHDERYNDKHF